MSEKATSPSPIGLIRNRYLEKKKKNQAYSMPAFARDLGISKSYLSRLFKKERPLTIKQTIQMAIVLEFTPAETDLLLSRVALHLNQNSKVSRVLKSQAQTKITNAQNLASLKMEQFKMMSNWYHLAILNLSRLKNFKSDSQWIAKRLGISRLEADDAIERLLTLGLFAREKGKLVRTQTRVFVASSGPDPSMAAYFQQTLDQAKLQLQENTQHAFNRRFIGGITLPVDPERIEKIKKRLIEIQDEFMEPVASEKLSEVYQMNFQFFPLTRPEESK